MVKIDIKDPDDVDHHLDGMEGEIIRIAEDDLGELTGDPRDRFMIRVRLENGDERDFRHRDLTEVPDELEEQLEEGFSSRAQRLMEEDRDILDKLD